MPEPIVIATRPFGNTAVEVASKLLMQGKPALDAAVAGGPAVEDDPTMRSVGYGGMANAIGAVTLDACVMDGNSLPCGAVGGVENVRHVAALARKVMEKTPHVFIVFEAARWFAIQNGFPLETLNTAESVAEWEKHRPKQAKSLTHPGSKEMGYSSKSHDTFTVLARVNMAISTASAPPQSLPTSCRGALAIRQSSGRACMWIVWPAPRAEPVLQAKSWEWRRDVRNCSKRQASSIREKDPD